MKKKFNLTLFLACLIGGLVGSFIAGTVYTWKVQEWNPIVVTGLYFAVLSFCICLPGVVSEWITNHLKGRMWDSGETMNALWMLPVGTLILFFILGALFQFIYGLGKKEAVSLQTDDYIIMIDNSGSTEGSDPQKQRFSSIIDFIGEMDADKKVMVTIFDSENYVVLPLTDAPTASSQITSILSQYNSGGNTNIQGALMDSLDKYTNSNRQALAILLSDGVSSVRVTDIADAFGDRDIPLFTIGFANMDNAGRRLLRTIAECTGGTFFEIGEVSQLSQALNKVVNFEAKRMLLEYRYGSERGSILYTVLRVLFLTLLGVAIGVPLILILDSQDLIIPGMPIRIAASLLGGIIMEFGLRRFWSTGIPKFLMCLLFALVVCFYTERIQEDWTSGMGGYQARKMNDFQDTSGFGKKKQGFNGGNSFDNWGSGNSGGRGLNGRNGNTFRKY